jgi:hypothetical protein
LTEHQGGHNSVKSAVVNIIWSSGGTEKMIIDLSVQVECAKKTHYGRVSQSTNGEMYKISANSVISFLVESTGRLGPAALSFLNRVGETTNFRKTSGTVMC